MGLISGKCPEYGASLKISDKETGQLTCPYCGAANINGSLNNGFEIESGVLKKYKGKSVDVVIPTTVKKIADEAFAELEIETVKIPDSVTSIGEEAFYNCTNLTSITIPNSVTSIGEKAFSECSSLTSITIPDSVISIGKNAFSYCSELTSITIGDSVTSIGYGAFFRCRSLTSIVVEENNSKYDSRDNCNAIIEKSSNTLIFGFKNTTIPDSVTSIGDGAFDDCSSLTSITIPDSVTSIGNWAFFICSSLTSITIGNSVTSIGTNAFHSCIGLTSITIPYSVTSIGDGAFFGCISLTSINFKGTMDQWNAISKGSNWNTNTDSYTIHCTDGEISKS